VVEGEWGWVEQITTTYVVVRLWDLRRLVVPLTYFIEKPFQNWTRRTADLLGTVFVYTDYSVPVEDVRRELHEILQRSGLWDGKVWSLQVTNTSDRAMELRALMSAPNGSKAWELRCHVREKLIQYLQHNHPESLPRTRTEPAGGVANAELRMPTKRELLSSAVMRNEIGETAVMANVLRIAAAKPGRGTSRCCDRRCGRGGKPSCGP
jgi:small-conductance mechanosensitive channel